MEKTKYLRTDFSRLFKKYPLYLAIVGVAVSLIFSLENYAFEKGMVNVNVMDTYMFAVEMSGKMIAYAFCASAFATAFCEDLENKYLRLQLPWTRDLEKPDMSGMYEILWGNGHFMAYIFVVALQMGMLAGTLSLAASFVSIFITNKMLIMLTPILVYQILLEFRGSGWANIMIFDPALFQFKSDMEYFLIVCGFSLVPSILFVFGIYRAIKNRL